MSSSLKILSGFRSAPLVPLVPPSGALDRTRYEGTKGFLSKKHIFYNQINIVYSECLTRRAAGGTRFDRTRCEGSIAFQPPLTKVIFSKEDRKHLETT